MFNSRDKIRDYDKESDVLAKALIEITIMPYKSDKPYDLMGAVETAFKALDDVKNIK